jgi:hypothetical protein
MCLFLKKEQRILTFAFQVFVKFLMKFLWVFFKIPIKKGSGTTENQNRRSPLQNKGNSGWNRRTLKGCVT